MLNIKCILFENYMLKISELFTFKNVTRLKKISNKYSNTLPHKLTNLFGFKYKGSIHELEFA
jgi:hypothetical protein